MPQAWHFRLKGIVELYWGVLQKWYHNKESFIYIYICSVPAEGKGFLQATFHQRPEHKVNAKVKRMKNMEILRKSLIL